MINWINKHLRLFKVLIFSLAGFSILIGGGYLLIPWNTPLNQPLDLPVPSLTSTVLPSQDPSATDSPQLTLEPSITPTPTIVPVCGGPPTMNLLISGVASNSYLYGLADAIRLARVDFQLRKVTVLAMPRDLWVEIPGLEDQGITVGKLNQAYFYGTEGMGYYSGSGYGSGLLAETLWEDYGYRADRYLAVNQNSFRRIVDALGGIDVYLPWNAYEQVNKEPKLFLTPGYHFLNGEEAEKLARNRITIGDYGRIDNQTLILRAVAAKLLSTSGIKAIPNLVDHLKSNVLTDLTPADISKLVCLAGMLEHKEDLDFITLPADIVEQQRVYDPGTDTNTAALVGDDDQIRQLLSDFMTGIWP
jgi:LCP family protein required for cell wall assembly